MSSTFAPMNTHDLKNIGPKTYRLLNEVGVFTLADLERLGPVEVYVLLKRTHTGVSLNALWALEAAVRGIHWTRLPKSVKDSLKREVRDILGNS